jgi:hypothetical protein
MVWCSADNLILTDYAPQVRPWAMHTQIVCSVVAVSAAGPVWGHVNMFPRTMDWFLK